MKRQKKAKELSAQMVEDTLKKMEKQGVLTQKGSTYSVTFRLDKGQMRINGKGMDEFVRQMMS